MFMVIAATNLHGWMLMGELCGMRREREGAYKKTLYLLPSSAQKENDIVRRSGASLGGLSLADGNKRVVSVVP